MALQSDDFSARVKNIRQQLSFSQEELARALGVSFATVNRWENGKTNPSRLAKNQFEQFSQKQQKQGLL